MIDLDNPRSDFCLGKSDDRICEISVCDNGEKPKNGGTYCGQGGCNLFGCNCDGGCIKGNALENFFAKHKNQVRSI